jgi:hypothetical protein
MSEILIPKYYNTKIDNHEWAIYMGGERYFPAYPAKWVEPEPPEKKIVKRYLVRDSSEHSNYLIEKTNKYPLSLLESFVNENDETMEFEGNTYYVWKGYAQYNESTNPEPFNNRQDSYVYLLTSNLDVSLPFTMDSSEFGYIIIITNGTGEVDNITTYTDGKYIFLSECIEYNTGEQETRMANVGVRMYAYETNYGLIDYSGDDYIWDYFQYDGETVDYEGQRCFVWNRYDTDELCTEEGKDNGWYNLQQIYTNTLWIHSLPFTKDSPEFVTCISYDDGYPDPVDLPFDRIEYFPDRVYEDNKIIKRYLVIDSSEHSSYTYESTNSYPLTLKEAFINENDETYEFEGETYYLWRPYEEYNGGSFEEFFVNSHLLLLTTTLEPDLPLTEDSPEIAYLIAIDSGEDKKDYIMPAHICIAQVNEYDNGERKVKMANVGVRMYNYDLESGFIEDGKGDYLQYDGETVEYNGQRCFVWYRYCNKVKATVDDDLAQQKILTNTLWISSLPFTMDSPEFVTWFNWDENLDYSEAPSKMPFDRIEYFPNVVYNPTPLEMIYTEEQN